jgi:hypothetical protein
VSSFLSFNNNLYVNHQIFGSFNFLGAKYVPVFVNFFMLQKMVLVLDLKVAFSRFVNYN